MNGRVEITPSTLTVAEYVGIIRAAEDRAREATRSRKLMIARAASIHGEAAIAVGLGLNKGHVWRICDQVRREADE